MAVEQAIWNAATVAGPSGAMLAASEAGGAGDRPETKKAAGLSLESELSDAQRLAATEKLLDEHQAAVVRYAYRLTGCSTTAEDIAQEVFLRAFRNVHQLRDEAAARGWLLVIARNEFARWCRKSAAAGKELDPLTEENQATASEELVTDRSEWVQHALQQLPEDFRLVVLMFYFENLSYAEIANQLEIPIGTVMSRLSRGKSQLKQALDASEND